MSNGFTSLGIQERLVHALQHIGVVEPTPIQTQAIPVLLTGADVIAQAQTGTGKTLAFVLPMLEMINTDKEEVQGLILTPTRELAIQISSELQKLAPVTGANVLAAYGGQDVEKQLRKLQGNIHIVVGTPGRLLDHLRRGSINFYKLKMLVLDEADQMLHMGFLTDVQDIIAQTSSHRQTLLFSATMPQQVRNLSKAYMKNAAEIQVAGKQITLTEIEQVLIQTTDRAKQDALVESIKHYKPYLAMIFCRTKRKASALNEALQEMGLMSDELHGDLSQAKREQVMKKFRDGRIELLVATDIAARGLDVEGVTHVFNYDVPLDAESYIHRIGRTGRAGQKGVAVTYATQRDMFYIELIEKGIKMSLRRNEQPRRVRAREEDYLSEGSGSARKGGGNQSRGARGGRNGSQDQQRGRSGRSGGRINTERGNKTGGARGPERAGAERERGAIVRGREGAGKSGGARNDNMSAARARVTQSWGQSQESGQGTRRTTRDEQPDALRSRTTSPQRGGKVASYGGGAKRGGERTGSTGSPYAKYAGAEQGDRSGTTPRGGSAKRGGERTGSAGSPYAKYAGAEQGDRPGTTRGGNAGRGRGQSGTTSGGQGRGRGDYGGRGGKR